MGERVQYSPVRQRAEIAAAERRGYEQAITHLRDEADKRNAEDGNPTMWAVFVSAADYLAARLTEETTGG